MRGRVISLGNARTRWLGAQRACVVAGSSVVHGVFDLWFDRTLGVVFVQQVRWCCFLPVVRWSNVCAGWRLCVLQSACLSGCWFDRMPM